MDWNGLPYHSLNYEMKKQFGTKIYKVSLNGGMTCPNRDGTLGYGGCIFCSAEGSGDFAVPLSSPSEVGRQIDAGIEKICHKMGTSKERGGYIAYFQSYTNTYAPVSYLRELFTAAVFHPQVKVLSIATRPDCLSEEILDLCEELNSIKPVWIELGLQTIHEDTAAFIRRRYPLSCFEDALSKLRKRNMEVIVHVILGLPGEDQKRILETISWLSRQDIQGIKLQLLHILKNTDLADCFAQTPFPIMTLEAYADLVLDCIALLPPDLVIHRLTGDGPKSLLIQPTWSANKHLVLNTLTRRFREKNIFQGCRYTL